MKVGTVISQEDGLHVITETINGEVSSMERLECFIAYNTMIQYDGEYKTLKEIIETHCDKYLAEHEVINVKL